MNNNFQYFGKSIYIYSSNMDTAYLINKYNCVIYIQKIKSNKNGFLVYSSNHKKKSYKSFNCDNNNSIIQTENRKFSFLIRMNSLSNKIYTQIQNKIFRLKNFLCVVYGFQFQYFNQHRANWYTYKLVKLFVSHKSFLIQITDCYFLIQPILKDLKRVLNGPICCIVDVISLSRLRNNLYEHLSIFFQSIVLMFKTFILQMEEDGEEVLTKIKETDVFRRQKPGTISFLKKHVVQYEDETFSEFRFLKKKTRSFLKMIALLILPLIIYRINQRIDAEPGLPKLAYVMFNSNEGEMQYAHTNVWNSFLSDKLAKKKDQRRIISTYINQFMQSNKSDKARIMKLLNAKINSFQLKSFNNAYSETKDLFNIDSLLFGHAKINRACDLKRSYYIDLYSKKKIFRNIDEHNLSKKIMKYAIFLIKPGEVIWNKKNSINDIDHISLISNNFIKNVDVLAEDKTNNILNQFSNLMQHRFKKHLNLEKIDLSCIKQLFFLQEINNKLNQIIIINWIKSLFYTKNETSIHTIISSNASLERNNLDRLHNSNLSPNHTIFKVVYINEVITSIKHLLKNYIQNTRSHIFNCFNLSLGSFEVAYQDLNEKLKYTNNLTNWNNKGSLIKKVKFNPNLMFIQPSINSEIITDFYKKNDLEYGKLLAPHLYVTSQKHCVNNFYIQGINKSLFSSLLEWIDKLYSECINDWNHLRSDSLDIDISQMILLVYPYFFEKRYELSNSIQFVHKIRKFNTIPFQEIKDNISCVLSKEQKQTHIMWHQLNKKIQFFDSKNTIFIYNNYQNQNDVFLKRSEFPSVQFVGSLNGKEFLQRWINNLENQIVFSQHDCLNSKNVWYSLTNIFKKYVQLNSLSKLQNNNHIYKENAVNQFNVKELPHLIVNYSQDSISNGYISNQVEIIKQYIPWLFTSEWWSFVKNANQKIWLIIVQDIYDYIYSNMLPITRYVHGKSTTMYDGMYQNIINNDDISVFNKLQKFHFFFEKQLQKLSYNFSLSIWENAGFSSFRINVWNYGASIISFSSVYWFSLLLGGSSLILWIMFERIRDLVHISWNTELDILVLANLHQNLNPILSQKTTKRRNRLQEQYYLSLQKWSIWFRLLYSLYFGSKMQAIWLYNTRNSDVYIGQKELASQLLVGETSILGLTLYNLDQKRKDDFGYQSNIQEGLSYLKQIITAKYKWYTSKKFNFLNNQRLISFSFYKHHSSSEELWGLDISGIVKKQYLPISLELSELYSKGILLIGPQDTGKSFLVKSLAADADLPLIYIGIDRLIDLLEFEDELLEGDSSLYFLRENIIRFSAITNFIRLLGSCIIWIPNIETIHDSLNYTSKIKEQCTLLILRYLLQNIATILDNNKHVLIFASCENTNYLDPGFVSSKRFNRFVNLRLPNHLRRPQIFVQFLKNKGLEIQSKLPWYTEFSNSTMGFSLRDLTVLANEALILSIQTKRKFLTTNDMRLVLYRGLKANQSSRRETYFQRYERIQYKIGRAIIQTTLVRPNPMIPIRLRYDLWKPRFYFLSKAYLQPDYSQSTVTQLQVLSHVLNCLAGSAARDAWLLSSKKILKEDPFYLNTEIEHDLTLAVNLFEAIFKEFPYLDICAKRNEDGNFIPIFKRMDNLVSVDQGNDVVKQAADQYQNNPNFSTYKKNTTFHFQDHLEGILPDISWGYRVERFSLSRNVLFNLLKRVDEPLSLFSSVRFFGKASLNAMFSEKQNPYGGHYHRSWDIMKLQIPRDLDYTFYGMLSQQRIKAMALPILSNQLIEYEPSENHLFFLKGRPIWNPTETLFCNLVFRQRQLLANEELLSILYIMYQTQQSRSLMATQIRKKELWTPDVYLENIAMNKEVKKIVKNPHRFSKFRTLAYANATFQRPQPEILNNSEISFLKRFIASNRFSRFSFTEDLFYQQNSLKRNNQKTQELLTYGTLLESYHYLLDLFIRKQHVFKNITSILMQKGILYEEDIKNIID